jgi:hypothetical protein
MKENDAIKRRVLSGRVAGTVIAPEKTALDGNGTRLTDVMHAGREVFHGVKAPALGRAALHHFWPKRGTRGFEK